MTTSNTAPAGASGISTIKIGYASPGAGSLPIWVAADRGIFRRNGVAAEAHLIAGTAATVEQFADGEIVFANIASPPLLHANLRGAADGVYLTGGITRVPHQVMVRTDRGIRQPDDLRGRAFGLRSSRATELPDVDSYLLDEILDRLGIAQDEVRRVGLAPDHEGAVDALERGEVDAITVVAPFAVYAEKRGMRSLVDSYELDLPFQLGGLVATRAVLAKERALAEALVRSYVEAVHEVHTDPEAVVGVIQRYSGIDDVDVARKTYDTFARYYRRVPYPSEEGIQAVLSRLATRGLTGAANATASTYIDASFVGTLEDTGVIDDLYGRR